MSMMPPEMFVKLRRSLIKHEGYSNKIYADSVGKITCGIGYNLSDRGVNDQFIESNFLADVTYFDTQLLSDFLFYSKLNYDRQIVLIDMAFMGYKKLLSFKKMFNALERQDFEEAAKEMLDSKWAQQVKDRAIELADAMKTGVYDV